jgi:hypothetical protein
MFIYNTDVPTGRPMRLEVNLTRREVAAVVELMCKNGGLAHPWRDTGWNR